MKCPQGELQSAMGALYGWKCPSYVTLHHVKCLEGNCVTKNLLCFVDILSDPLAVVYEGSMPCLTKIWQEF